MKKTLIVLSLLGILSQPVLAEGLSTTQPYGPTGGAVPCPSLTPCPTPCPTGGAVNVMPMQPSITTGAPVTISPIPPCPTGGAATIKQTAQPCPTGGAVTISPVTQPCVTGAASSIGPTVQPVQIQKKRWWQRKRTGYIPVCPGFTGAAAACNPCTGLPSGGAAPCNPCTGMPSGAAAPCNPCEGITGGAAPTGSAMTPVLVPKRHFWEKDNVQMMQVSPAITGFAAPCPCPSTSPCPTPGVAPISPTGGAAQMTPNREIIKQKVKERMETRKGRATGGAAGVRGYW